MLAKYALRPGVIARVSAIVVDRPDAVVTSVSVDGRDQLDGPVPAASLREEVHLDTVLPGGLLEVVLDRPSSVRAFGAGLDPRGSRLARRR